MYSVNKSLSLGNNLADDGPLDAEIEQRISKASNAFESPEETWSDGNLINTTMLSV